MARPYRLKFENACYLVFLQGVEGLGLFVEREDAEHFVRLIELSLRKHRVRLHAYALAANSAELVVETPNANLSAFLQGVQTAFARHIRQYYVHSGPIMQGRYRAKVIEKDKILHRACEWVHTLPVRDSDAKRNNSQKVKALRKYPFSSFRHTVGVEKEGLTDPSELLRMYGSPVKKREEAHAVACEKLVTEGDPAWEELITVSPVAIGSEDFVEEMRRKHQSLREGKRVKGLKVYGRRQRGVSRTKLVQAAAEVFEVDPKEFFTQRHASLLRPVASYLLYRFGKMTQREIAEYLGLGSSAAVSLQIKRLLMERAADPELEKRLGGLEARFPES